MKEELSIEEKAKRYDEILARATGAYLPYYTVDIMTKVREFVEYLLPELKESEDEKIRKGLLYVIEHHPTLPIEEAEEYIAWLEKQGKNKEINEVSYRIGIKRVLDNPESYGLEKQGEKNPADKVEPKFKIEKGKWYICIRDVDDNYGIRAFCKGSTYYSTKDETLLPNNSNIPFEIKYYVNECFRPWTIKDAKVGDVLVSESQCGLGTWYCIFKSLDDDESMAVYCYLARDGRVETKRELCFDKDPFNTKPATKEQRDLLFQKMYDAGYKWDAEKKELKKIKQTYTNNQFTSEQASVLNRHIDKFLEEKSGWDEDEKIRKSLINYIHCYGDAGDYTKKEFIAWVKKQGEHANFLSKIQVGDKVTRNEAGILVNISQLNRDAKPANNQFT